MKALKIAAFLSSTLLATSAALAQCPAYGQATDCTTLITATSAGLSVVAGPGGTTYDGSDDQLVGFTNNTTSSISSIFLNGGTGNDIFGFDLDGIDTYGAPGNAIDTTGYGAADSYFSNISPDFTMGTVNFITPIAPGGFTYFSLEDPFTTGITGTTGSSVTPEPGTIALLGTGALGLVGTIRRRLFN